MSDTLTTYLLLCVAAFAAGVVNALAGGGTLLTFPTLVTALGGTAAAEVIANVTSTVALVPGSMASAWGFRRELRGTGPWLRLLTGPSVLGGLVGALLLTRLDPGYFRLLVPWLLLTASLLFLAQPHLARLVRPGKGDQAPPSVAVRAGLAVFQFFVAVYGGYFGAGIGILMLSSLGLMGLGDLHRMNAIKTFLASSINGVSVLVFVLDSEVRWGFAAAMAVAAILGGFTGAHFGRRLPRALVRWFVILVGFALALHYFRKLYNPV
jgi:uncharacterized membrane protein YfcA